MEQPNSSRIPSESNPEMQGVQNSDLETANDPSRALDMIHDIEEVFEDFKRKLSGSYLHLRESLKNDMQSTVSFSPILHIFFPG